MGEKLHFREWVVIVAVLGFLISLGLIAFISNP